MLLQNGNNIIHSNIQIKAMGKLVENHEHKMKMANDNWIVIPDTCGPSWWAILHNTVLAIKTDGCESCGGNAVKMMSFLHDMVNVDLDKKVYDPKNVLGFQKLTKKLFKQANEQLGNGNRKMKAGNPVSISENTETVTGNGRPVAVKPCNTTLLEGKLFNNDYFRVTFK